jgi:hypothetical protein
MVPADRKRRRRGADPFLDAADAMADVDGLDTRLLSVGDVIDVETHNHLYTFLLEDPSNGAAEVMSNGEKIVEPTEAALSGTLLGESTIRSGWVCVGYRLEIGLPGNRRVVTSPVRRIAINGTTVCPRPDGAMSN